MSSCINYEEKIIFIHTPRCAGSSISRALCDQTGFKKIERKSNKYYKSAYEEIQKLIDVEVSNYKFFSIVRHPLSWLWSGYNFCNYYNLSFDSHLIAIANKTKFFDYKFKHWFWHCCILPDKHFPKSTMVFKYEELDKLKNFFNLDLTWYNDHTGWTKPFNNADFDMDKILTLVNKISNNYSVRWNYANMLQ